MPGMDGRLQWSNLNLNLGTYRIPHTVTSAVGSGARVDHLDPVLCDLVKIKSQDLALSSGELWIKILDASDPRMLKAEKKEALQNLDDYYTWSC